MLVSECARDQKVTMHLSGDPLLTSLETHRLS